MARLDAVAVRPPEARAEQQYESVFPRQAVERSCAAQVPERLAQREVARVQLRAALPASEEQAQRASPQ